jgi:hypothetical protein
MRRLLCGNRSGHALANAANDARDVHARLAKLGYASTLLTDPSDLEALTTALASFAVKLRGGAIGLFFFAGHGMQDEEHETFLLPLRAAAVPTLDELNIGNCAYVFRGGWELRLPACTCRLTACARTRPVSCADALSLRNVVRTMRKGGAAAAIVLLDACRLNAPPFGSAATRALAGGGGARGMRVTATTLPAQDGTSSGTVVAWACGDGQVASDGDSARKQRNGLFTKHLLKHMAAGSALDALLARVRDGVAEESQRRQLPCISVQTLGRPLLLAPNVSKRLGGGQDDADAEEHGRGGGGALLRALLRGALAAAAVVAAVKAAQLLAAAAAHRRELGAADAEVAAARRRARALEAQLRRAEARAAADAEVMALEEALRAKAAVRQQAQAARNAAAARAQAATAAVAQAAAREAAREREAARQREEKAAVAAQRSAAAATTAAAASVKEQARAKIEAARVRQEAKRLADASAAAAHAAAVHASGGGGKTNKNGDALDAVAAKMVSRAASSAAQRAGCSAIQHILDRRGAPIAAGRTGVVEATVAALTAHRANEGVADACCRALNMLVLDGQGEAVMRAGGAQAMVGVLHAHPAARGLVNTSLVMLGNAAFRTCAASADRAGQCGTLGAAVEAMRRHPKDDFIQSSGCYALTQLMTTYDGNANRTFQAGGMDAALSALRAHGADEEVQRWCCDAVGTCTYHSPGSASDAAVQGGGVELAIKALRKHRTSANVTVNALYATYGLITRGWGEPSVSEKQRRAVEAGALEGVASALRTHNGNAAVQSLGLRLAKQLLVCDGLFGGVVPTERLQRATRAGFARAASRALKRFEGGGEATCALKEDARAVLNALEGK